MVSNPCPNDPELLAWDAKAAVPEPVRLHIEACGACRLRVDNLRAELSALRHVAAELPAENRAVATTAAVRAESAVVDSGTGSPDERSEARTDLSEANDTAARPDSIGRYRIVGLLDAGGQAAVYRALHPTLPRDVAIKIAHRPSPIDQSLLRADAELLCDLDHPNLVKIYDLDLHEGRPYVVMEFVRGLNLEQVAEQSPPSAHQAAAWVVAVARALECVHRRNVVHQDIKPSNIMLDESGRPRLIDFGMARW